MVSGPPGARCSSRAACPGQMVAAHRDRGHRPPIGKDGAPCRAGGRPFCSQQHRGRAQHACRRCVRDMEKAPRTAASRDPSPQAPAPARQAGRSGGADGHDMHPQPVTGSVGNRTAQRINQGLGLRHCGPGRYSGPLIPPRLRRTEHPFACVIAQPPADCGPRSWRRLGVRSAGPSPSLSVAPSIDVFGCLAGYQDVPELTVRVHECMSRSSPACSCLDRRAAAAPLSGRGNALPICGPAGWPAASRTAPGGFRGIGWS